MPIDKARKPDIAHSKMTGSYYFVLKWNTDGSAHTKFDITEQMKEITKAVLVCKWCELPLEGAGDDIICSNCDRQWTYQQRGDDDES